MRYVEAGVCDTPLRRLYYVKIVGMAHKIVFMGSPEFALPSLQALAERFEVVGVVTQPDRPAGRGQQMTPPPVKRLAQALGIPLIQPRRLKEAEALAQLAAWAPQAIVVAAFGQILRQEVLDLPQYGCINVHASLLPRWRGAAPIQAAILHGDAETGITIMQMEAGLDTGAVLSQRRLPILETDTAASLTEKLARLGADLLVETLPGYFSGMLQPVPQDDSLATLAPRIEKAAGALDLQRPAEELARQVRAFNPWPGASLTWQGQPLKVHQARPVSRPSPGAGARLVVEGLPAVGTSEGILLLETVQPAGKKAMPGQLFLQGARAWTV